MPLIIQTNIASLQSQKNLNTAESDLMKSFNKLSSGFRINSAADDAAGLAISESMKAQIRSFTVAERNANDAVSMSQSAEGALSEVSGIVIRMRELAMQGANGSLGSEDRAYLNTEFSLLKQEISRMQASTTFNGKLLLSTSAQSLAFQVGLNATTTDQIKVTFGNLDLTSLLAATVGGSNAVGSLDALSRIDASLNIVSMTRARYGAVMNRLQSTTSNIQTMRLNLQSANSRIRDVDVADETSAMSRNQVLSQAGAAVLAQANQLPQLAISLLK